MAEPDVIFDWAAAPGIVDLDDGSPPLPVVNLPNGPAPAGSSMVYTGVVVDVDQAPIPGTSLVSMTLTLVDTLTGAVVNGVSQVNILNTGRGAIDALGNLTITLLPDDTALTEAPGAAQMQRSMVIDWTYGTSPTYTGRHQANFVVAALAGP